MLTLHKRYARALYITRYNLHYEGQFFIQIVDLTLANILEDGRTILRFKMPNFTPSIFSILHLLPTSEIYSAFLAFEIFSAFTAHGIASSRLLLSMYWYDEFLNRSAKSLNVQASRRKQSLHITTS